MKFPPVSPIFFSNPFASTLKLAPWNRELGSIGQVVDEQNTPVGEGDYTSCIPQGEAILQPLTKVDPMNWITWLIAMRYGNSRQGCESNGVKVPCRQLPDSDG